MIYERVNGRRVSWFQQREPSLLKRFVNDKSRSIQRVDINREATLPCAKDPSSVPTKNQVGSFLGSYLMPVDFY